MRFNNISNITKLMVLGSSVCNLQCDYCYLRDQHKNNAYVLLNKEIQKAWKDGTYVENIKKVFSEIKSPPERIRSLEIWGGEPLIMTNNLIKPLEELLTYFKNIDYINIPTNFTRINGLFEFIQKAEEVKQKQNFNSRLNLHVQISTDAPDGELQKLGHDVSFEVYKKNIISLFEQLSTIKPLEKIYLLIEVHATLEGKEIIRYLDTYKAIKEYCDAYNDFHLFVINKAKEYNLDSYVFQMSETTFPHNANPMFTDVEDALKLEYILSLTKYVGRKTEYKLLSETNEPIYFKNACSVGSLPIVEDNPVCMESGVMALTIMYDGTICECPCDFIISFDKYWDWIKDNPLKRLEYRQAIYKKQFYINPLIASQKEKDDFDWYIYDAVRMGQSSALHLMMNFYIEMALSGQLDYTYVQDPEKLLSHLTQFNYSYSCPKDQLTYTFTPYMGGTGYGRRFFNGIAEMAQSDLKDVLCFEIKEKIHGI